MPPAEDDGQRYSVLTRNCWETGLPLLEVARTIDDELTVGQTATIRVVGSKNEDPTGVCSAFRTVTVEWVLTSPVRPEPTWVAALRQLLTTSA